MQPYLALITPLTGGHPDQGLPGFQPYPDQGLPGAQPGPSHPIYIPGAPPGFPGSPSHPIYIPGVPTHPIAPGGGGGRPTHPIAPGGGGNYPDQGLPGDQPSIGNPIYIPPSEGQPPGIWIPVFPSQLPSPGGTTPPWGINIDQPDQGLPVPPDQLPGLPEPPTGLENKVIVAIHKPGEDWVVKAYDANARPDQGLPQPPPSGQPPVAGQPLPPHAQPKRGR